MANSGNRRVTCKHCGREVSEPKSNTRYCGGQCVQDAKQARGAVAAHSFISREIRTGQLAHPSTLKCADCGRQATCYDHRDYGQPAAVQAVCRSCNARRGPALAKPTPIAERGRVTKPCAECGDSFTRHYLAKLCFDCVWQRKHPGQVRPSARRPSNVIPFPRLAEQHPATADAQG